MNGWWGWKYVIVQLFWKYANHPIQPKASTLNSWTYDMAEYLPVSTLLCKKCKKMLLHFSFPYYRVSKNFDHQASPYVDEKSLIRLLEKLAAHTEFRTLTKGRSDHHLHNVDNYHPHHRHHHRRHRSIEHHTNLEDLLKMSTSRPSRPAYGRASRLGPPGRNDSRHVDSGHVEYHHSRTEGDAWYRYHQQHVIFNVFILTTITDILIIGEDSTDHWLRGVCWREKGHRRRLAIK